MVNMVNCCHLQPPFSEACHTCHLTGHTILVYRQPGALGTWVRKLAKWGLSVAMKNVKENDNWRFSGTIIKEKSCMEYSEESVHGALLWSHIHCGVSPARLIAPRVTEALKLLKLISIKCVSCKLFMPCRHSLVQIFKFWCRKITNC